MDLGVYVVCKDEENLIVPCVSAVQKVFPQVEIIDIGSTDQTLERLKPLNCRVTSTSCTSNEYPDWKNSIAEKHDWVFWIDGDEIYPQECLARIIEKINSGEYHAYRMSWKFLQVRSGILVYSRPLINGTKIYRPKRFQYIRSWPYEVLTGKSSKQEPERDNGIWCWHGKLLNRSTKLDLSREIKRREYRDYSMESFHGKIKWQKIEDFPWENPQHELWKELE